MDSFNDRILQREDADGEAAANKRRRELHREELTAEVNYKVVTFYDFLVNADFPTDYPDAEFDIVNDVQGRRTAAWFLSYPASDGDGGTHFDHSGAVVTADGVLLCGPLLIGSAYNPEKHNITSHRPIWEYLDSCSDRPLYMDEDEYCIHRLKWVDHALNHHIMMLS